MCPFRLKSIAPREYAAMDKNTFSIYALTFLYAAGCEERVTCGLFPSVNHALGNNRSPDRKSSQQTHILKGSFLLTVILV